MKSGILGIFVVVVAFLEGCHKTGAESPDVNTSIDQKVPETLVVRVKDGAELQMLALGDDVDISTIDGDDLDNQFLSNPPVVALDGDFDTDFENSSEAFYLGAGGGDCYVPASYTICRPFYQMQGSAYLYNFRRLIESTKSKYNYYAYGKGPGYAGDTATNLPGRGNSGNQSSQPQAPYKPPGYRMDYAKERNLFLRSVLPSRPIYNSESNAIAKLGREWFFDTDFSVNKEVSCATCHRPEKGFADGLKTGQGIGLTSRNTPSLINVATNTHFFWDGRVKGLADQAKGPIEASTEHGASRAQAVNIIYTKYLADYESIFGPFPPELVEFFDGDGPWEALPEDFDVQLSPALSGFIWQTIGSSRLKDEISQKAAESRDRFGRKVSPQWYIGNKTLLADPKNPEWVENYKALDDEIKAALGKVFNQFGEAVAAYQNTIRTEASPFDKFADKYLRSGDYRSSFVKGFGEDEYEGWTYFAGKSNCINCHSGPYFTDRGFHNIGLIQTSDILDVGRAGAKTANGEYPRNRFVASDVGAFKTPSLRNASSTAPYFHDGSAPDLESALKQYRQTTIPAVGERTQRSGPFRITDYELVKIKLFIESLTADVDCIGLTGDMNGCLPSNASQENNTPTQRSEEQEQESTPLVQAAGNYQQEDSQINR